MKKTKAGLTIYEDDDPITDRKTNKLGYLIMTVNTLRLEHNKMAELIDELQEQIDELKGGNKMRYKIKPEYLDLWEGGEQPSNPDRIITEDELKEFSKEWGKPVVELLEQLTPVE